MQKFTVFSIILSLSVILIIGDIVFHDYLSADISGASAGEAILEGVENSNNGAGESGSESGNNAGSDSSDLGNLGDLGGLDESAWVDQYAQLSSEGADIVGTTDESGTGGDLPSEMLVSTFFSAGFFEPILKEGLFAGLVFQTISFADQGDATTYQYNLFDGENFIGSIYEFRYPTETGSFQGYLALRERAGSLTDVGELNEANNYGDASFYFNHFSKTKTVHLVMKSRNNIYAFEYAYKYHDQMKDVFELMKY